MTQPIRLSDIRVDDAFWNKYTKLVTKEILPYQWRVLHDEEPGAAKSHCIENFRIAAGEAEGEFYGFVFQDTDLAKWIEAAAFSLSYEKNPALEAQIDEAVELIAKAQQPDGYLDTYFIVKEPNGKWANLRDGHELYTAGHMMEAAVAYYEVTGKDRFLKVMEKNADLICEVFHTEAYRNAVPGHQEVEIGLVKLYHATGKKKYLEMAKAFLDRRGTEPNYLVREHEKDNWPDVFHTGGGFEPAYSQCDRPVRMQKKATGHAVRACYMYAAMADVARECGDASLLAACETLYDNVANRQMYLTGGVGASGTLERFTCDYDLPNDRNYSESCASIALAMFTRRMAQMTHEEKYIDTMERALYNTVLAGIAMDGKSFFYVNPMEVWPENCMEGTSLSHVKPVRQKWFGCACCPPNIARTLASLGQYICFADEEDGTLWLNLLAGCEIRTTAGGEEITVRVGTKMPFSGVTDITIHAPEGASGRLMLRVPRYAGKPVIRVDGEVLADVRPGSYAEIVYAGGETQVFYTFSMPARFVWADPLLRADAGKAAVMEGPLVYCAEACDNGDNLPAFFVDTDAPIGERYDETLLGGTEVLTVQGERLVDTEGSGALYRGKRPGRERAEATLIPYCYWGNRKPGEMLVWMREK